MLLKKKERGKIAPILLGTFEVKVSMNHRQGVSYIHIDCTQLSVPGNTAIPGNPSLIITLDAPLTIFDGKHTQNT